MGFISSRQLLSMIPPEQVINNCKPPKRKSDGSPPRINIFMADIKPTSILCGEGAPRLKKPNTSRVSVAEP